MSRPERIERRGDGMTIVIDPGDAERAEVGLLVSAFADGAGRPRRLAIGSADGAPLLAEILHGRRNGKPHPIELVPSNEELTEWLRRRAPSRSRAPATAEHSAIDASDRRRVG